MERLQCYGCRCRFWQEVEPVPGVANWQHSAASTCDVCGDSAGLTVYRLDDHTDNQLGYVARCPHHGIPGAVAITRLQDG
jgi:hypothetical protein